MEAWRGYDVDALKNDIEKLEVEIKTFKNIVDRSVEEGKMNQAAVFTEAVEKAREDIKELKGYVRLIEDANTV